MVYVEKGGVDRAMTDLDEATSLDQRPPLPAATAAVYLSSTSVAARDFRSAQIVVTDETVARLASSDRVRHFNLLLIGTFCATAAGTPCGHRRIKARTMKIGIPKEIKESEFRVGLTPASERELTRSGHSVIDEHDVGSGIGFDDASYQRAGASVVAGAAEVFAQAQMIVKVKEPQQSEIAMLRPEQALFTYLHLAADREQTQGLMRSGATCIAYETVTDDRGGLPLLAPMSDIAGRMSAQVGAHHLEKPQGGLGILLGGVAGVAPAKVVILGGGVAGTNAARMAVGLSAQVTIIDRSLARLKALDELFGPSCRTLFSTAAAIDSEITDADLVIGAVLIPGASAPKLITRPMLTTMKRASVIVDIAIDQGGCVETSRPTTHSEPTYVVDGVIHYCVANMPGAVPRTATIALNNATLPFVLELANKGWDRALEENPHLKNGLNIRAGRITHPAVEQAFGKAA
jgi:alanine dehydrogenase